MIRTRNNLGKLRNQKKSFEKITPFGWIGGKEVGREFFALAFRVGRGDPYFNPHRKKIHFHVLISIYVNLRIKRNKLQTNQCVFARRTTVSEWIIVLRIQCREIYWCLAALKFRMRNEKLRRIYHSFITYLTFSMHYTLRSRWCRLIWISILFY